MEKSRYFNKNKSIKMLCLLVAIMISLLLFTSCEEEKIMYVRGTVKEIKNNRISLVPDGNDSEDFTIRFSAKDCDAKEGDKISIRYYGYEHKNGYATVKMYSWQQSYCNINYSGQWMDKTQAQAVNSSPFNFVEVKEIYADCFIGTIKDNVYSYYSSYSGTSSFSGMGCMIKVNGSLPAEVVEGMTISFTYNNLYEDTNNLIYEADMVEFGDILSTYEYVYEIMK